MAKRAAAESENPVGMRELIVVTRAELMVSESAPGAMATIEEGFFRSVKKLLGARKSLVPLFTPPLPPAGEFQPVLESAIMSNVPFAALHDGSPSELRLDRFHAVTAPDEELEELAEKIANLDEVEGVYVKPPAEPAVLNDMPPSDEHPPAITPDFSGRQLYLSAAPAGIDAQYAWRFHGGRGAGVQIVDCEWGWRFTHEDLQSNQGGVLIGTAHPDDNHGTAVLGEFSGDRNNFGIVGICSDARASAASFNGLNTATVIQQAANLLSPGDILLLEIHRAGPDASGNGQDGYIAVEWWPDDLAAIRYAINRGIIVVEAAGNGSRNLDAALYDVRPRGFPMTWKNPFNPANPTSGAVVVGAGAPPPGTHGRDHGPDRSRLDFSNYGRRIDAQGWGREVTTTGYGDLQGGANRDLWYTDQFSGTSSASPIVVGAIGCLQGILRARGRSLLTPQRVRTLLRSTGSPQQDATGRPRTQRIGNRPNLRELIPAALGEIPTPDMSEVSEVGSAKSKVTIRGGGITVTIEFSGDAQFETS